MSKQPSLMVTGILSSPSGDIVIDLAKGTLTMKGSAPAASIDGARGGEPFLVEKSSPLADQILVSAAAIGAGTVDAAIAIKAAALEDGSKVMAGLIGELREPMERHLEGTIRRVLREELKPGGMLHSR